MKVKSFDLKDVCLFLSCFCENMMCDFMWMVFIEVNRLLYSFCINVGVFVGCEGGYMIVKKLGGWEFLDCELCGYIIGYLFFVYGLMYVVIGSEQFK